MQDEFNDDALEEQAFTLEDYDAFIGTIFSHDQEKADHIISLYESLESTLSEKGFEQPELRAACVSGLCAVIIKLYDQSRYASLYNAFLESESSATFSERISVAVNRLEDGILSGAEAQDVDYEGLRIARPKMYLEDESQRVLLDDITRQRVKGKVTKFDDFLSCWGFVQKIRACCRLEPSEHSFPALPDFIQWVLPQLKDEVERPAGANIVQLFPTRDLDS